MSFGQNIKYIDDSHKQSKFNVHIGMGLFNGLRIGLEYRISNTLSISGDCGVSPFVFLGGGKIINSSINYSPVTESYLFRLSIARHNRVSFNVKDIDYYVFQNFGWIFELNTRNAIQFSSGLGAIISYENEKYKNWVIRPNLDIIFEF